MYSINEKLDGRSVFITDNGKRKEIIIFSELLVKPDCLSTIRDLVETFDVSDKEIYNAFRKGISYYRNKEPIYQYRLRWNAAAFCRAYHYTYPEKRLETYKVQYPTLPEFFARFSRNFRLLTVTLRNDDTAEEPDLFFNLKEQLDKKTSKTWNTRSYYLSSSCKAFKPAGILMRIEKCYFGKRLLREIDKTLEETRNKTFLLEDIEKNLDAPLYVREYLNPLHFGVIRIK